MKQRFKSLRRTLTVFLVAILAFQTVAFAATTGQVVKDINGNYFQFEQDALEASYEEYTYGDPDSPGADLYKRYLGITEAGGAVDAYINSAGSYISLNALQTYYEELSNDPEISLDEIADKLEERQQEPPADTVWGGETVTVVGADGKDSEEVIIVDEGGKPAPADKTTLAAKISEADAAILEGIVEADDASKVEEGKQWMTAADKTALDTALANAKTINADDDATAEQIAAAITALNAALSKIGTGTNDEEPVEDEIEIVSDSIRIRGTKLITLEITDPGETEITSDDFTVTTLVPQATAAPANFEVEVDGTIVSITLETALATANTQVTVTGKENLDGTAAVTYTSKYLSGTVKANDETTTDNGTTFTADTETAAGALVTLKIAATAAEVDSQVIGEDGKFYFNLPDNTTTYNVHITKDNYAEKVEYAKTVANADLSNLTLGSTSTAIKSVGANAIVEEGTVKVATGATVTNVKNSLALTIGNTTRTFAGNISIVQSEAATAETDQSTVAATDLVRVQSESLTEVDFYEISIVGAEELLATQLRAVRLVPGTTKNRVTLEGWVPSGMTYRIGGAAEVSGGLGVNLEVNTTDTISIRLTASTDDPIVIEKELVEAAMKRADKPAYAVNYTTETVTVDADDEYNDQSETNSVWYYGQDIPVTIKPGTTYYFREKALPGKVAGEVQTMTTKPRDPAPPASDLSITPKSGTPGTITLSVPAAKTYEYCVGTASGTYKKISGTSVDVTGVSAGQTIFFRKSAVENTSIDPLVDNGKFASASQEKPITATGKSGLPDSPTYKIGAANSTTPDDIAYIKANETIRVVQSDNTPKSYSSSTLDNFEQYVKLIQTLRTDDEFEVNATGEVESVSLLGDYDDDSSATITVDLSDVKLKSDATIAIDVAASGTGTNTLEVIATTTGEVEIHGDKAASIVLDAGISGDVIVNAETSDAAEITLDAPGANVIVSRAAADWAAIVNLVGAKSLKNESGTVVIPAGETVELAENSSIEERADLTIEGTLIVNKKLEFKGGSGQKIVFSGTSAENFASLVVNATGTVDVAYGDTPPDFQNDGDRIIVNAGGKFFVGDDCFVGTIDQSSAYVQLTGGSLSIIANGGNYDCVLEGNARIVNTDGVAIGEEDTLTIESGTLTVLEGSSLEVRDTTVIKPGAKLMVNNGGEVSLARNAASTAGKVIIGGIVEFENAEDFIASFVPGNEVTFRNNGAALIVEGTHFIGPEGNITLKAGAGEFDPETAENDLVLKTIHHGRTKYTLTEGEATIGSDKELKLWGADKFVISDGATLTVEGKLSLNKTNLYNVAPKVILETGTPGGKLQIAADGTVDIVQGELLIDDGAVLEIIADGLITSTSGEDCQGGSTVPTKVTVNSTGTITGGTSFFEAVVPATYCWTQADEKFMTKTL